jgi:hypothetical protein
MFMPFRKALTSAGVVAAALVIAPALLGWSALGVGPAQASVAGQAVPAVPAVAHATTPASQPVTGVASTSDSGGYWQVAADGSVYSWGDAVFHGALPPTVPNAPVVGIARTSNKGG